MSNTNSAGTGGRGTPVLSEFRTKVDNLIKNCDLKLKDVKDNVKRVETVLESELGKEALRAWHVELSRKELPQKFLKYPETSRKLREEGNEYYKLRNLNKAHEKFTLALCYAPSSSKEEVLAYSNRSASSIELQLYKECCKDIERAEGIIKVLKDPSLQSIQTKLTERRLRCIEKLKNNEKYELEAGGTPDFFTLKSPNGAIPSAESFVEIKDSEGRGRHVIVTKDVDPGTLIILEKPFSKCLINQGEKDFCNSCFKPTKNPIPCPQCPVAVYCSEDCLSSNLIHSSYECGTSSYFLASLHLKRLVKLSFRTVLTYGVKNLQDFWNKHNCQEPTARGVIKGFNLDGKYKSDEYLPIHSLIYHDDTIREQELLEYTMDAILLTELLQAKTNFFESQTIDSPQFTNYIASIILLHQLNYPCNAHSLNLLQLPSTGNISSHDIVNATTNEFGAGAFALLSLINHSCDPNIVRITLPFEGTNAVIAIKRLKAGDEVLDNYGVHFALQNRQERQKHLMEFYQFQCACVPCKYNWPEIHELEKSEARFICNKCSKDFSVTDFCKKSFEDCVLDGIRNKCRRCGSVYQLEELKNNLDTVVNKFQSAYETLLENKPLDCIKDLTDCLKYIESNVLPPFITENFVQETLKQGLNMIAGQLK